MSTSEAKRLKRGQRVYMTCGGPDERSRDYGRVRVRWNNGLTIEWDDGIFTQPAFNCEDSWRFVWPEAAEAGAVT